MFLEKLDISDEDRQAAGCIATVVGVTGASVGFSQMNHHEAETPNDAFASTEAFGREFFVTPADIAPGIVTVGSLALIVAGATAMLKRRSR